MFFVGTITLLRDEVIEVSKSCFWGLFEARVVRADTTTGDKETSFRKGNWSRIFLKSLRYGLFYMTCLKDSRSMELKRRWRRLKSQALTTIAKTKVWSRQYMKSEFTWKGSCDIGLIGCDIKTWTSGPILIGLFIWGIDGVKASWNNKWWIINMSLIAKTWILLERYLMHNIFWGKNNGFQLRWWLRSHLWRSFR